MTPARCLCGCARPVVSRGICGVWYQRYKKTVAAGETNWGKLAKAGKCLHKKKVRGRFMLGKVL